MEGSLKPADFPGSHRFARKVDPGARKKIPLKNVQNKYYGLASFTQNCHKHKLFIIYCALLCTLSTANQNILLAEANSDANRLYEDLMMTYNRIVRPVQNNSERLVVRLSLKLSQLIDVNLKNQMMTTNVWLNQEWDDYKLKWDPSEYGGIEDINLPAEQIWLPDIVLYNSAEGYFAVSIMTKAKVRFDGHVTWNPPAIFRSSCQIDITFFPFDSQNCHLKFGSWTFGTKIDLRHINDTESNIERGTDLSEYYQNVEWDIMEASAKRNVITYSCCPNDFYGDVTFNFKLRRKPLFYTVNLILPCVGITILSFLVFYLPSDSGEKVTLTISILVSLIFFLSVLIETIPSTSLAMPLLGKYLAFTMILITVSVCATVCVLNIHFRTPSTHSMPSWVKRWFIDILPRFVFMTVPQCQSQQASTILPEQLIYPHNLAYVAQQQAAKQSSKQPAAGGSQKLNQLGHSQTSESRPTPTANQSQTSNNLQLDPAGLADWHSPSNKLNASPSSLFLPYLQSEAARRLQLQRSRSSERDSSSNNNNNLNLNNNCDTRQEQQEWPRQTVIAVDMQQSEQERRRLDAASRQGATRSNSSIPRGISKSDSNSSSAGLLTRLFTKRKSSLVKPPTVRMSARFADEPETGKQQQQQPQRPSIQQDTSSSLENDYQHHNHFQARASVCSTNLWRIGPTRRCSLAVPADYPTYYRPLTAHLAASQHPHEHLLQPGNQQRTSQISTLSCCVQNGAHFHLGQPQQASSESSSSGPAPQAVSALVSAAAGNLITRPKQANEGLHSQPVRQHQQQFAGYAQAGQQHFRNQLGLPSQRQYVNSPLPTPPPPLPPANLLSDFAGRQQINAEQVLVRNVSTMQRAAYATRPTHAGPSPTPTVNRLVVAPERLLVSPYSHSNSRPTFVLTTSQAPSTNLGLQFAHQSQNLQQTSGQTNQSCKLNLGDSKQQPTGFAPPLNRSNVIAPSASSNSTLQVQYNQKLPVNLGGQLMSRSRSTDHRLCMYAHPDNQLYLTNQEMQRHQQSLEGARIAVLQGGRAANPESAANQQSYLLQQSPAPSIGRALGQAYMQKLQRQPAVYSLGSSAQRPSRSIQRGTAYFVPLELGQPQVRCSSALNSIRRSRSQTSLPRPQQFNATGFNQCDHRQTGTDLCRLGLNQQRQCPTPIGRSCQCQTFGESRMQATTSCSSGVPMLGRQASKECCGQTLGAQRNQCQCQHRCDGEKTAESVDRMRPAKMSTLSLMKLMNEVDKAIQNAMFIAQHIDNLDEFESVKENWKYIAMVIDRIFLMVFLFACTVGTVTIFAMVPWSYYTTTKPIDLQLTRMLALNFTSGEPFSRSCQDF